MPDEKYPAGGGAPDKTIVDGVVGTNDGSGDEIFSDVSITPVSYTGKIPGTIAGGTNAPGDPEGDVSLHPSAVVEVRYEDQGELGEGGMSTVRRVLDKNLLRPAALKILDPQQAKSPYNIQRFIEEAQITGQLEHPGIVPVHDLGVDENGSYHLLMKLVRGDSLEEAVKKAGEDRLKPARLAGFIGIMLRVCDAVAFAHSRGVFHRDLKPPNIMVGDFGQVYVLDWGVAHLARPMMEEEKIDPNTTVRISRPAGVELDVKGTLVGTPQFMAPEQVHHDPDHLDERTDVFGLGALLYYIATGKPPYRGPTLAAVVGKARIANYPRPRDVAGDRVPYGLEKIILKAMTYDPDERYQSVPELQRDLEGFMHGTWHVPTQVFPPGSVIITQGEPGDSAFLIVRGHCRVLRQSGTEMMVVKEFGPGEVFGEAAVFSDQPRTASIQAIDEVEVMVVTKEYLTQTMGLNSWVGPFVRALAERFCEVEGQLRDLEQAVRSSRY